jgi:GNAT superfamily N-acetyltransferase
MAASSIDIEAALAAPGVRVALPADLPRIVRTQRSSMRVLGARYYSELQIESIIRYMTMMEEQLLADGTYYVAEIDGQIAGCGGWSVRMPAYQTDAAASVPAHAAAKVRAFYVHPQYARRGVGRALLDVIEAAIIAAGHNEAVLDATVSGMPFYKRCGYRALASTHLQFPNGVRLPMVGMHKRLELGRGAAAQT